MQRAEIILADRPSVTALERILEAPRAGIGRWPTPIDTIAAKGGPAVLVKRDDLSGWGRGGAKARKIDLLVGHLVAHGHDELITVAGNITNLAFDLLPALERAGIRASVFILDDPPVLPEAREVIFAGVRDRVTLIGRGRLEAARRVASRWIASRRAGRRPFVALPGVSHPVGVVGNARGFVEMAMQRLQAGRPLPLTVFVSAATGTTVAGFLLGAEALRAAGYASIDVIGVQVYPGAMRRSVWGLLRWTELTLGLRARVPPARIAIDTAELHGGFGCYPPALADRCRRLQEDHAIALDPIFGGKSWGAMERALARDTPKDEDVLYWHCGFTPEWRELTGRPS
jgi:1-aminocyclopropane-1-carboxylate deaminase/D-cysteine desulfhydrase-like pyridoxal-dependent ACC family enzyme